MDKPYLIQRLLPPFANAAENRGKTSVDMVFGGARDLSQEQHDVICDIFRLDNMGSAHFEFGAIPNALYRLATNENLRAFQVDMVSTAKGGTLSYMKLKPKIQTLHIIADPQSLPDILLEIKALVDGDEQGLKCNADVGLAIHLAEIQQVKSWAQNMKAACGWHDIQNDFLFFTDKAMFDGVRERFEIAGDVTALPQIGKLKPETVRKPRKNPGPQPL